MKLLEKQTKVDNVAFQHTRNIAEVNLPVMTSNELGNKTDVVAVKLCCK